MKKRWLLTAVIAITAGGGGAFYSATLLMSESLYSDRGTFAYWLTISDIIKGVPEVEPLAPARFFSSAGDGPKQPEATVSYRSAAEASRVSLEIAEYLAQRGYQRREDGTFERENSIVSVEVTPEGKGTRVQVREVE